MPMKPRILITGVNGLLGSSLVDYFHDRARAFAVCRHCAVQLNEVETIPLDIRDRTAVQGCLEEWRPDIVIHCAAETRVDFCEQNPRQAHRVNALAAGWLAVAAQNIGAKIVYISTDSVYSGEHGRHREDETPDPVNVYAQSKLAGEVAILRATDNYLILRTNMYGWSPGKKQSLAEWMVTQLASGKTISGFQDIIFSPLLVNQLAELIDALLEREITGLFNLGSRDSCSKYDFAHRICREFSYRNELIIPASSDSVDLTAQRPKDTSMNVERVEKALGLEMPEINDGVSRLFQLKENGYPEKLKRTYQNRTSD